MADIVALCKKLNETEPHIEHFGVQGMRWGVRRTDAQLAAAASLRKQKTLDKLEIRDKKAKVKAVEADARSKMADAKRKEAETKKLTKESKAKIKQDQKREDRAERRLNRQEKAAERKAKIAKQEEARKEALRDNKQTDTKYSYDDYKRMSDAELKAIVSRMNTEKQYRDLNPKPPSTMSKILKTVSTTAKTAKDVYEIADAIGVLDKVGSPKNQQQINKVLNTLAKDKSKKK